MILLLGLRAAIRQGLEKFAPANDGLDSDHLPGDFCSPRLAIFDNGHMTDMTVRCYSNDNTIILLRTAGNDPKARARLRLQAEDERLDRQLAVDGLLCSSLRPALERVFWPASCFCEAAPLGVVSSH